MQSDIDVWRSSRETELQKYNTDVQDALNKYNKELAEYQAQLQISLENAKLNSADDVQILQKFTAEIQNFQAQIAQEVQKNTLALQEYRTEYEWIQGRLLKLQRDYDTAFIVMQGKAPAIAPPQEKRRQERRSRRGGRQRRAY